VAQAQNKNTPNPNKCLMFLIYVCSRQPPHLLFIIKDITQLLSFKFLSFCVVVVVDKTSSFFLSTSSLFFYKSSLLFFYSLAFSLVYISVSSLVVGDRWTNKGNWGRKGETRLKTKGEDKIISVIKKKKQWWNKNWLFFFFFL
jgi:hypothetical protein